MTSERVKGPRAIVMPVLRWTGGIVTAVIVGVTIWALQQYFSNTSRSGPPVKVASLTINRHPNGGDTWLLPDPIHLASSDLQNLNQLQDLAQRSGGAAQANRDEWFVRRGGVGPGVTVVEVVLLGNRNHEVRIIDLRTVAHCRAPLDGTIFYSPPAGPAGGEPTIGLEFDLDSLHPVAQHYADGDSSRPYFAGTKIGLRPDEQQVLTVYSKTQRHYCEFSLELTIVDGTKTVTQTLTDNGHPFRVSGQLGDEKSRMPLADYKTAYIGGVQNTRDNGGFAEVPPSFDVLAP